MNLVYIDNNRPVTDSLTVAETFGKEHARVLRDIRELECSEEFRVGNFAESSYTNAQNRTMPKYLMTEQGFAFLVMGYTGKEAARFKEMYINEFNRMKQQQALQQFNIPQTLHEALYFASKVEAERVKLAEHNLQLVEKIQQDKPLVVFAESVQVSDDSILVREMARMLRQKGVDTGETRFYEYLRQNGYLVKSGSDRNLPTQKSMELGIMEVKRGTRSGSDGVTHLTRTTKITGKGQIYFMNKFLNKLPQVQ